MDSISVIRTHFILYVEDQARSTAFYSQVFGYPPSLNVPGMTEFALAEYAILGLMPIDGLKRLLGEKLPKQVRGPGDAHCEIYLLVSHPLDYHQRAVEAGAVELSRLANRDWGHRVAYSLDPDGHVLAFAEQIESELHPPTAANASRSAAAFERSICKEMKSFKSVTVKSLK